MQKSIEEQLKVDGLAGSFRQKVSDLKALVKFRLSITVVFSAVMGFIIASGGQFDLWGILALGIGGFLVTGAANTINQVLESDYDSLMKRTANRPLAAKRMSASDAMVWAGFMSMFGIVLLALFNPWTALLGMISFILYSFIYTPLKRHSPLAVLVGAIPGALPTMIGAVAAHGYISYLAITLFFIQFFWQFPHFWAIAWLGHEDYTKAGFNLLPNRRLDQSVGLHSKVFALFMIPVLVPLFFLGNVSGLVLTILVLLCVVYAYLGHRLEVEQSRKAALKLMFGSLLFLPISLTIILLSTVGYI